MPPKRRDRQDFQCMSCDVIIKGDEQINHRRKIHKGDPSVKFRIYLGDNSKQPKLCFFTIHSIVGAQVLRQKEL